MALPQSEKLRHLAICLPLFGLFLLMPPVLLIFGIPSVIAGIPLIVLYIFGIWGGLIAAAAFLARHLNAGDTGDRPAPDGPLGGGLEPNPSGFDPDRQS